MTSEWHFTTPTIPGKVTGGPEFDMPHPEATDDDTHEEAQEAWFNFLSSAVGK